MLTAGFLQRVVHRAVGHDRMQWLHRADRQACWQDHPQIDRGNTSRSAWIPVLRYSACTAKPARLTPWRSRHCPATQVASETTNSSTGLGASSVPPSASGWSVRTLWPRTYFCPWCFTTVCSQTRPRGGTLAGDRQIQLRQSDLGVTPSHHRASIRHPDRRRSDPPAAGVIVDCSLRSGRQ